jgi:hypothetical protein
MNATLLTSSNEVLPRDMGMMPSRRAKNGWYPGIEADRKLIGQLDRMAFKMGRGGGWVTGLAYRTRLVRLGIWKGTEPTPSAAWETPAQEVWLALVEAELKKTKDRMQGKVRKGRKKND